MKEPFSITQSLIEAVSLIVIIVCIINITNVLHLYIHKCLVHLLTYCFHYASINLPIYLSTYLPCVVDNSYSDTSLPTSVFQVFIDNDSDHDIEVKEYISG